MRPARFLLATLFTGVLVGLTVTPASALVLDPIYSVSFSDANTGYLAGYCNNSPNVGNGFISVTHDGGATWSATVKTRDVMHAVAASGASVYAVPSNQNRVYRSVDQGKTWPQTASAPAPVATVNFNDVAVGAGGRVALGGIHTTYNEHGNVGVIRTSADGGVNWLTALSEGPLYASADPAIPDPLTEASVESLDSTAAGTVVWAVANEWTDSGRGTYKRAIVYRSTDGGSTFTTVTATLSLPASKANDITAVSSQVAYIGATSTMRKTVDGGSSWTPVPASTLRVDGQTVDLYGIDALDANTLVAVGANIGGSGICVRSTDGGVTWTGKTVTGAGTLRSVSMLDATHWVAVGDNETVLRFSADAAGAIAYTGSTSTTAPAVAIESPVSNQVLTSDVTTITGTASDSGSGVSAVEVKICRDDTEYWNGTTWQAAEVWVPASTSDGWGHWMYRWDLARGQIGVNAYTITSRATDGMGLTRSATMTGVKVDNHTLVDVTPPTVAAYVVGSGSPVATLTASATDDVGVVSLKYMVNGAAPLDYATPVRFTNAGSYDVTVTAADAAGNVGTAVAKFTIVVDTQPPTLQANVNGDGTSRVTITASADDALSPPAVMTYEYSRDGLAPVAGTFVDPMAFTTAGSYVATITATDGANNSTFAVISFRVVGDYVAPTLSVRTYEDAYGAIEFDATAQDVDPHPVITFSWIRTPMGGAPSVSPTETYTDPRTFSDVGDYVLTVAATDASQNTTSTVRSFTVTDTTPPEFTPGSVSVAGDGTTSALLSQPTATDNSRVAPVITYTVNGGADTTPLPRTFTVPGSYTVVFTATDGSSKSASETVRFTVATPTPPHTPAVAERVPGANRYDVAINLARTLKPSLAFADVIVACGEDRAMADPLGAAALAAAYDCPVLLTPTAKVNSGTVATIKAMAAANGGRINIHVVGGTTSVPKTVYNAIAAARGAGTCERINGANRYDLAYRIAARTKAVLESRGKIVPGVIVVNIENASSFNDALAASPVSARAHLPLIGVKGASVPGEAAAALSLFSGKPRYALNSAYLTPAVRNATGASTVVASSANREVAAVDIAKWGVANGFVSYRNVGLANKLSDALPAGAVLGQLDGVMLYTGLSPLSATTGAFLPTIKTSVDKGWVFGGTATIADATAAQFGSALQ